MSFGMTGFTSFAFRFVGNRHFPEVGTPRCSKSDSRVPDLVERLAIRRLRRDTGDYQDAKDSDQSNHPRVSVIHETRFANRLRTSSIR